MGMYSETDVLNLLQILENLVQGKDKLRGILNQKMNPRAIPGDPSYIEFLTPQSPFEDYLALISDNLAKGNIDKTFIEEISRIITVTNSSKLTVNVITKIIEDLTVEDPIVPIQPGISTQVKRYLTIQPVQPHNQVQENKYIFAVE